MSASANGTSEVKSLCRAMVERCDGYLWLKNTPDAELKADEIRNDIVRLYGEISTRNGKR